MKNITYWLKSLGILFLYVLLTLVVCISIMYAVIYANVRWNLNIDSWPIFVSILVGTGLFFAIRKSFGEFRKIK